MRTSCGTPSKHGQPSLELHLGASPFVSGRSLCGVVVLRLPKTSFLRSIVVSLTGKEYPTGTKLASAPVFFSREILLTGQDYTRSVSEKLSRIWNTFLGRDMGRSLSRGEHAYPFCIALPVSLPPSFEGKAGVILYEVTARANYPMTGGLEVSSPALMASIPRPGKPRPIALRYPTANGAVHEGKARVSLELDRSAYELGQSVIGRFHLNEYADSELPLATVSLENCQWLKGEARVEIHREMVDVQTITPADNGTGTLEIPFDLKAPSQSAPSVEGTAISVIWLLKLSLNTEPPMEIKAPVTVYRPPG